MLDGVVRHDDVMQWLSSDVRRALTLALPPEQRGWYTAAEADASDGCFVEVQTLSEREPRYIKTR